MENLLCFVTIKTNGYELFYWTSETPAAEVDFVIQRCGKVIPVEVKYDTNVHARSFKHYQKMYAPAYGIRISGRNFGYEDGVMSVPLYAAFCI